MAAPTAHRLFVAAWSLTTALATSAGPRPAMQDLDSLGLFQRGVHYDSRSSSDLPALLPDDDESSEEVRWTFPVKFPVKSTMVTTTTPATANGTALTTTNAFHVSLNSHADLKVLVTALITNGIVFTSVVLVFMCFRRRYPLIMKGRELDGDTPTTLGNTHFKWVWVCASLSIDQVQKASTLDHAMLIQFHQLCMWLCIYIGLPHLLVILPLDYHTGGMAAGGDLLSRCGFSNVVKDSWLVHGHAVIMLFVTCCTMQTIYTAQEKEFLPRRFEWLRTLPAVRATTVMVENISEEHRSDELLKAYFSKLFSTKHEERVEKATVVKMTQTLKKLLCDLDISKENLMSAKFTWARTGHAPLARPSFLSIIGPVDTITFYEEEIQETLESIRAEKARIEGAIRTKDLSVYSSTGFVTFTSRKDAVLALQVQYKKSEEHFRLSVPPDPADVLFDDLQQSRHQARISSVLGWGLVVLIFLGFLPIIVSISAIANIHQLQAHVGFVRRMCHHWPLFAEILDGIVGSLALVTFIEFLPSVLMMVFYKFLTLRAAAWAQHLLQQCYFAFLLLFVVLVMALGTSIIETLTWVLERPTIVIDLLAQSLPLSSHFYMKYLILQWVTQALVLSRYIQVAKFVLLRTIFEEGYAKKLSEEEDQDCYGMGARSARFSINMVICLIFCSLTPLMLLMTFVNFAICRVFFTYLFVFAETRKTDLGGVFWARQLNHLQLGVLIYILLMIGVLSEKTQYYTPQIFGIFSLGVWSYYLWCHVHSLRWKNLPFEEIALNDAAANPSNMDRQTSQCDSKSGYEQPELMEVESWTDAAASMPASGGYAGLSLLQSFMRFGKVAATARKALKAARNKKLETDSLLAAPSERAALSRSSSFASIIAQGHFASHLTLELCKKGEEAPYKEAVRFLDESEVDGPLEAAEKLNAGTIECEEDCKVLAVYCHIQKEYFLLYRDGYKKEAEALQSVLLGNKASWISQADVASDSDKAVTEGNRSESTSSSTLQPDAQQRPPKRRGRR